ncbi:MAG: choline dehydrogenase, partial [Planctomycetales bacterium]|nr:choline dehydrogenase [Planctomycetales bacterium]
YQVTQKDGHRHSTAAAFLKPIRARQNLHIMTSAEVVKLGFEGTRATGVTIRRDGQLQTLSAAGEVILSAGTIG